MNLPYFLLRRALRGGRVVKSNRGVVSLAPLMAGVLCSCGALAQESAIRDFDQSTLTELAANDDRSSPATDLGFTMTALGRSVTQVYVNNNGNVTLDGRSGSYVPVSMSDVTYPIFAAFWSDVDTGSPTSDVVRYGQVTVGGRAAFVANYLDVGYYADWNQTGVNNRFQLVFVDRSDVSEGDVDVEYNYGTIAWENGSSRTGLTPTDGTGVLTAVVGWSDGTGAEGSHDELDGSGVAGALLDSGTAPLVAGSQSSPVSGRYIWYVRDGVFAVINAAELDAVFAKLSRETNLAFQQQKSSVLSIMQPRGHVAKGQKFVSYRTKAEAAAIGDASASHRMAVASATIGYGISDALTLGGAVSFSGSAGLGEVSLSPGYGLALWGDYQPAETGLGLNFALGAARANMNLSREALSTEAFAAHGEGTLETRAVNLGLRYRFAALNGWSITPSGEIARAFGRRSAYDETGATLDTRYEAAKSFSTTATLRFDFARKVGTSGEVTLGIGAERDLSSSELRLRGTSDLPTLASFDIASDEDRNRDRPFASLGYAHQMAEGAVLRADAALGRSEFGSKPSFDLSLGVDMRF